MKRLNLILILLIASTNLYAQTVYEEVAKKIQGRWLWSDVDACDLQKSEQDGIFYKINSKGNVLIEFRKNSIATSNGIFTSIELYDKNLNQYRMISQNLDMENGEKDTKISIVEFDEEFNLMKIIDLELNGVQKFKNSINLSNNEKSKFMGFKCNKNKSSDIKRNYINELTSKSEIQQRMDEIRLILKEKNVRQSPFQSSPYVWDDKKGMIFTLPPEIQVLYDELVVLNEKLNKIHDEEKMAQLAQDKLKQEVQRKKDAAAAKIASDIENQKLNACLNSGKISICSFKAYPPRYKCGSVWRDTLLYGYQWVSRFCDDNSKYQVSFKSKNNLSSSVKDITYRCESIAKSGTALGSIDNRIYDLWNSGDVKDVTFIIPNIAQTHSINCYAKTWQ